jgi:mannonate dehydratase
MKMTFRWYGDDDKVSLDFIKQIPGINGIVTAVYDIAVGEIWPPEKITDLIEKVKKKNLECEVIESVPVHEDIKLGLPSRDQYIENYKQNIKNLSKAGIKVICYNFMPVFDWTRSALDKKLPDGSTTLVYLKKEIEKMNPLSGDLSLPGWDTSYDNKSLTSVINKYKDITEEKLWDNLSYFLKQIIPIAEQCNIKMAIHPDDPPWSIFNLPRIITDKQALNRLIKIIDTPSNGIALCTGSLGVTKKNSIPDIAREFSKKNRINFVHVRNVKILGEKSFEESAHLSKKGSLDIVSILQALYETGFDGYIRPDHGRMIWGEKGRPGYGLYDRALGVSYINGIWETLIKLAKKD